MTDLTQLVTDMVCSIVDNTEQIKIVKEETDKGILFEITVSEGDVGKLIGTKGRVASSLRTVARAAGAKQGLRVLVNVMDKPL